MSSHRAPVGANTYKIQWAVRYMAEPQHARTMDSNVSEVVDVSEVSWDVDTDIVVCGGGACGLSAGLSASEDPGLRVTILEKNDETGGNMRLAAGSIPAAGSRLQKEAGIDDTPEEMAREILEKCNYEANEELVHHLCEQSADLIHWLIDEWDVNLSLVTDYLHPRKTQYRIHSHPNRKGSYLADTLREAVDRQDNIELLTNTPVRQLVKDGDDVVGVIVGENQLEAIEAQKVILATDGFGGNMRMKSDHISSEVAELSYGGSTSNTGDGIRFGSSLGAAISNMGAWQGYAAWMDNGKLFNYAQVMHGAILVNKEGNRFGDESKGYSAFVTDMFKQPDHIAYAITDQEKCDLIDEHFGEFEEEFKHYQEGETVADLAEKLGLDPDVTSRTVSEYNEVANGDADDRYDRTERLNALTSPFYGVKVNPAIFHTQGGLVINTNAQVERPDGSVIGNLYAGGGNAVGISGTNNQGYSSGNGLLTALGFGRIAGRHARQSP